MALFSLPHRRPATVPIDSSPQTHAVSIRPSQERGYFNHGWLETYHTFSFAGYFDPDHTGFRHLRVLNEDRVQPGKGFAMHPHRDMEILTYVLSGTLDHRDSMGNTALVKAGQFQYMGAGTGVRHSEYNRSTTEPLHFLQIWIEPERKGCNTAYAQITPSPDASRGRFGLVASRDGRGDSLMVRQNLDLSHAVLTENETAEYRLRRGRSAWVQVVRGGVWLNSITMDAGDGAFLSQEALLEVTARRPAEVLVFDMA